MVVAILFAANSLYAFRIVKARWNIINLFIKLYFINIFIYIYVTFCTKVITIHLDALSLVSLLWYFNNIGLFTVILLLRRIDRRISSPDSFLFSSITFSKLCGKLLNAEITYSLSSYFETKFPRLFNLHFKMFSAEEINTAEVETVLSIAFEE